MKRLLILSALALLLGGCGAATNIHARNDMAGKVCVADVQDEPFMNVGNGLITGQITAQMNREIAERNTARRQAARAQQPPGCPPYAPRADQAPLAPSVTREEKSDPRVGGVLAVPNVSAGQTVYSQHECIGAVVMGQCHGSILPDYSRPHPTCYGQMLNGMCTGPMF